MATYRSNAAGLKFVPYDRPEGACLAQEFLLTINATVANADVFILGKLPKRSTLLGFTVDFPQLDSGTATLNCTIGDAGSAAKFSPASGTATFHNTATRVSSFLPINATTTTTSRGTLANTLPAVYTNSSDLRVTITGAPNTGVSSGTIRGFYLYTMRPEFGQP